MRLRVCNLRKPADILHPFSNFLFDETPSKFLRSQRRPEVTHSISGNLNSCALKNSLGLSEAILLNNQPRFAWLRKIAKFGALSYKSTPPFTHWLEFVTRCPIISIPDLLADVVDLVQQRDKGKRIEYHSQRASLCCALTRSNFQ